MATDPSQLSFLPPASAQTLRILRETPACRIAEVGSQSVSLHELVGAIVGDPDVALRVLAQYPTIADLARLHGPELTEIAGMGPARVAALQAAVELGRRATLGGEIERRSIRSPHDAAQIFMSEMGALDQEEFRVMLLDIRNRIIAIETVYRGNVAMSIVRTCEVYREAVRRNAPNIIVAHNHPSGGSGVEPSPEDVAVTRSLVAAGKLLDIELEDHLVVTRQRFVSLKERGLGFD